MKLMHSITQSRNPFRVAYFVLLFLLTGALVVVLTLNTQNAAASNLAAQTALGTAFTYQGHLNDGANSANGAYDFQFNLFDVEAGGAALNPTPVTVANVNVQQGVFTVKLDFGPNAFTGAPRWLGISVRPAGSGNFNDLNPRQAISPAPYALYADSANNATNASNVPWTGVTGLSNELVVSGDGINITSNATTGAAVKGSDAAASGQNFGVAGSSKSPSGYGIYGRNDASSILLTGTDFAWGVYGYSDASGGIGVQGVAGNNTLGGFFGVYGVNTSAIGDGVSGHNYYAKTVSGTSCCAEGVYGQSDAIGGIGVDGFVSSKSGNNAGVAGFVNSASGFGMFGRNNASSTSGGVNGAWGVYGRSDAVNGIGVEGYVSPTVGVNYGVVGYVNSLNGVGIYGENGVSGGLAGKFVGDVNISGKLTLQGQKSFKIDHPLDPTHKYLYHAAIESPEMMNLYNGNVVLDANGEALVQMPAWFEALNMEFRYQLTAIGAPGPNLYISQEITNNQFKIAGGAPNTKVSWQVTGIRHDPYAQAHPMRVEEDKPVEEQGTYLAPVEYGQPAARGLNSQPAISTAGDPTSKVKAFQADAQQAQPDANK
ncbi:MAG: hypothetical protein U0350_02620 [Caldilineaceae bacterium]